MMFPNTLPELFSSIFRTYQEVFDYCFSRASPLSKNFSQAICYISAAYSDAQADLNLNMPQATFPNAMTQVDHVTLLLISVVEQQRKLRGTDTRSGETTLLVICS